MKKVLLVTLISAATLFTACSKPVTEVKKGESAAQQTTQLSTNNKAQIQADIDKIQVFAASQEAKVVPLEQRMDQAMQSQDKVALQSLFGEFEAFIKDSNKELKALVLRSSEVSNLREKMIESSLLGLEMSKSLVASESTEVSPEAIQELQAKAIKIQNELMAVSQDIHQKIQDQPATTPAAPEQAKQ